MSVGVLIALLVGTVLPALAEVITREATSYRVKAAITGVLSALTGAITTALFVAPQGTAQWEALLVTTVTSAAAAYVAYWTAWKPSGAAAKIARATASFGIK